MRIAEINNGVVENVYLGNKLNGDSSVDITDNPLAISIGWAYENGVFSAPEIAEDKSAFTAPEFPLINRVQFKSMLALLGKSTDDVLSAIDAVITDPTQNTIAKVKVTDSDRYARDNELFTILAPSMNLTDAEIDAAWDQAVLI